MRVFLSHSSADKPLVETLARGLAQRGIDPWFDQWEMGPGDNLVARINEGLATADAGIIVLSEQSSGSRWVEAELSNLIYNRIQEGQLLLPVKVADGSPVPELIKPLLWISIEDIEGIAAALLRRGRGKPPVIPREQGKAHQVLVNLSPAADHQVAVAVTIDGTTVAEISVPLPQRLRGPCWLPDPAGDPGGSMLGALAQLGRLSSCWRVQAARWATGWRLPWPRPTASCWLCPLKPCDFPTAARWCCSTP